MKKFIFYALAISLINYCLAYSNPNNLLYNDKTDLFFNRPTLWQLIEECETGNEKACEDAKLIKLIQVIGARNKEVLRTLYEKMKQEKETTPEFEENNLQLAEK